MRAHLGLACLLLVLAMPGEVRANVSGAITLQGQSSWFSSASGPGGVGLPSTTSAAFLQESLSLQWTGMPLGPSVAMVTMGGQYSNFNGLWGTRGASGRLASVNASVGLLPRRSYPLRLYATANVLTDAPGGGVNVGRSLLAGASLNLPVGNLLPGVRVDAEELRTTSPVTSRELGDLRRSLSLSTYRFFGKHKVDLSLSSDTDSRETLGRFRTQRGSLSWSSPNQHSLVTATRSSQSVADLVGLTDQRQLLVSHNHSFSRRLTAMLGLQGSEARAGGVASGNQLSANAGLGLRPFLEHDLTLSGAGGASRTLAGPALVRAESRSAYGDIGVGYGRVVGPVQANLHGGLGINRTVSDFESSGTSTSLRTGVGVSSINLYRLQLRADYVLHQVYAPVLRGGDRIEHAANGSGTYQLTSLTSLNLGVGYSNGQREFLNIATGETLRQLERAGSGYVSMSTVFGPAQTSAEVRHARGSVVLPESTFVATTPPEATSTTQASIYASMPLLDGAADVRGRLFSTWANLSRDGLSSTYGATAGLNYRFGRFYASVDYQFAHYVFDTTSTSHVIFTTLSRPFEL